MKIVEFSSSKPNVLVFSFTDILRYLRQLVKDYPTPCRIWLGPRLFVLLDHPDDVQIALNSPHANSKGCEYEFLNVYPDASGLITANGEMWKKHRKLLNPCFIPKILDAYLPIFNGCSKVLNEKVDNMCRENLMFDIEPLIHCCTFDQICGEFSFKGE
jgi:cytochrome P450